MKKIFLSTTLMFVIYTLSAQHTLITNELFATDKLLHVSAGYVTGASITAIADSFGSKNAYIWGIAGSALVGIGKEYYDYQTESGDVEMLDGWSTILGGILGAITVQIPISNKNAKSEKKDNLNSKNFENKFKFY